MSSSSIDIGSEAIKRDCKSLVGLLGFAKEVLTARSKVQMEMASGLGVFREQEISGLPGVLLDQDDGAWLRLKRQRATRPPELLEHVAAFVTGLSDNPDKRPELLPAISVEVSIDEASDLAEADLLRSDNISEITENEKLVKYKVKVTLHVEDFLAVQQGFESYLSGPWQNWSDAEKPVRKAIKLYNDLFTLHSAIHSAESTPPELVWGVGIARWKFSGHIIDMPMIEQSLDIEVEESGEIAFRPRDINPKLSLKSFIEIEVEGAPKLQRSLQESLSQILKTDIGFTPFASEWEHLLATAAAQLTSSGEHIDREALDNGEKIPGLSDQLVVVSSWAIFGRPRSSEAREQDLEALRQKVDDAAESVPKALLGFASAPPEEESVSLGDFGLDSNVLKSGASISGWEAPSSVSFGKEAGPDDRNEVNQRGVHFFPLPFNQEQGRIIEMLEESDVVSVTGPPGTGKTHSIANIISHMMATGKRVLVTARTPEAIAAVREKLPESLRPLVIASVGTDRESAEHLKSAVSELSDKVIGLNKEAAKQEMQRLEASIVECDRKSDEADSRLAAIARENLSPLMWRGREYSAMELLDVLSDDEKRFAWFSDRPTAEPASQLVETLDRLRKELPCLAPDIIYSGAFVPKIEEIPSTQALIEAHDRELAHRCKEVPDYSSAPAMARDTADAERIGSELLIELSYIQKRLKNLDNYQRKTVATASSQRLIDSELWDELKNAGIYISGYQHLEVASKVAYDIGKCSPAELVNAAQRAAAGQNPVPFGFFNKSLKEAVATIRLGKASPETREDWIAVHTAIRLEVDRGNIVSELSELVSAGFFPDIPKQGPRLAEYLVSCSINIDIAKELSSSLPKAIEPLSMLFPYGLSLETMVEDLDLGSAIFALEANLQDLYQPADAIQMLGGLELCEEIPVHDVLIKLKNGLGSSELDHSTIVSLRAELTRELKRLSELQNRFQQLESDLKTLEEAGAPDWVGRLRKNPLEAAFLIPDEWESAWQWAMMRSRIDRIISLGNGDEHRASKEELQVRRRRLFEQLISTRTLLGLSRRMTSPVQRAMAAFTQAVSKIGKGTGKNAPRYVKAAQEAAKEASKAAPVWVMPEYKIPEQLPAELGEFDLVILDEASQSDITAIAALARGKKMLIVGDEEQVSPSNVGIASERINAMRAEHLYGVPNAKLIDENSSIFEITMRMYPTSHLVLREHFRCVAPIIQFSTQFYSNRLIPLRVPKASERFDPPLVDVYIKNAKRTGKTNKDEAKYIVDEIASIVIDPAHFQRNIGVISLLGNHQADLIERMLIEDSRVGPEKIAERDIIVGDARIMQGQERSVVFLSMVATPSQVVSQSKKSDQQRINVAMSRAADRLYLVRSLRLEDLKPQDIKSDILKHFQQPMPEGRKYSGIDLLDRCDSGFEREVLSMLLDANYRVRPQVEVGGFRIDLVVEGAEDRRLAIELDGDAFHGPEVWERDMARQAVLERAGWVFWRIFGSQWHAQKEYWWNHLLQTLSRMGIEPIGAKAIDERFTEFLVIEPFGDKQTDNLEGEDDYVPVLPGESGVIESLTLSPIESDIPDDTVQVGDVLGVQDGSPSDCVGEKADSLTSNSEDEKESPEEPEEPEEFVQIGSVVVIEQLFMPYKVMRFKMVENYNSPEKGLLGSHTPLGEALIDAIEGDVVEYHHGNDFRKFKLIEVS